MRGLELLNARSLRRTELRRIATDNGYASGAFLALDQVELLYRAALDDPSSRGDAVKRRLILSALASANVPSAAIAAAWRVSEATIAEWKATPLLDPSGRGRAIDSQVLEELPETPEPGRVQEPPASIDARNDRRWAHVD